VLTEKIPNKLQHKNYMEKLFIIIFFFVFIFHSPQAFAHPIFPNSVVDFMNENPDATQDEYEKYMKENAPEFLEKYGNVGEVKKLVRADTNFVDNSFDFIKLGVQHILEGTDHILFILALLLVFVSFHEVLKLTSTFTIAHSLTILLAGTSILTLSPRVVEPIIAFSIAYVAAGSVFFKNSKFFTGPHAKIVGVFFFGLFHGLGFAGLLQEIRIPSDRFVSSLISFNIGIEIGQILIVLCALPFIYFSKNKPWYPTIIKILAALITLFGIIWGIERIFQ
jgi:hypothetical protein